MCINGERLELYCLGRLTEPEATALEEHLLLCESCQDRFDEHSWEIGAIQIALEELSATTSGKLTSISAPRAARRRGN
jgi:predicted anti-sigma-YlaC factor YlaD